jgi:hypothetical protein
MFNVSVQDSYTPVGHSSIKGLGPTLQRKDIFDFTTLKGNYHLAASWCCMNNSTHPTFKGPDVLRTSACNGSLISNVTKSSTSLVKTQKAALTSYCILPTVHHQCILTTTKNTRVLKKNCAALPCYPDCPRFLPEALMSLTTCFQVPTPKGFYALKKDISLWEGHRKRTVYGDCHIYTQIIFEEIGQLPNLYPVLNISLFGVIP